VKSKSEITAILIVSTNRGGKDFLKYKPISPALLVHSSSKKFVGSAYRTLASKTAGLDKKIMRTKPMIIRKNLMKWKWEVITPMFFHRISNGSEAFLVIMIVLVSL